MKRVLFLGGIPICFESEREIPMDDSLKKFQINPDTPPEVRVKISWDWENAVRPTTDPVGEDLLDQYYREKNGWICDAKSGGNPLGPLLSTWYTDSMDQIVCTVNEKPFQHPVKTLDQIIRLMPMRSIYVQFGTLFFHAAQVEYHGAGILFSGRSGIGKTTQSRLWQQHVGATRICNDRTMLRKRGDTWFSYGYPMDGSDPVSSDRICRPVCVVMLDQKPQNVAVRIHIVKALCLLMGQVVQDSWNTQQRNRVEQLLMELVRDLPIFLLEATADTRAVDTLIETMEREGIHLG